MLCTNFKFPSIILIRLIPRWSDVFQRCALCMQCRTVINKVWMTCWNTLTFFCNDRSYIWISNYQNMYMSIGGLYSFLPLDKSWFWVWEPFLFSYKMCFLFFLGCAEFSIWSFTSQNSLQYFVIFVNKNLGATYNSFWGTHLVLIIL